MRQRKLRHLDEKLERISPVLIRDPEPWKGRWREAYKEVPDAKDRDLYLELGCGKGAFLKGIAEREREDLFLGADVNESVLFKAGEMIMAAELANALLLDMLIRDPRDVFAEDELDGVYLNFSDPWPKARHEKRRLTSRPFLEGYEAVTKKGGFLAFKTDNEDLFRFSVEQMKTMGYDILAYTEDLHQSEYAEGNIVTEYESRFIAEGKPIFYIRIGF